MKFSNKVYNELYHPDEDRRRDVAAHVEKPEPKAKEPEPEAKEPEPEAKEPEPETKEPEPEPEAKEPDEGGD